MRASRAITLLILFIASGLSLADVAVDFTGKPYRKSPVDVPGTIKATEYDVAP
jgi:hypothetical protein